VQFIGSDKNLEFYGRNIPKPLTKATALVDKKDEKRILAGEETLTKKSKRMKNLSSEDIIDKVNSMNPREYSKQQTELNAIDRKEKNKSMVADLKKKQGSGEEEKPMTKLKHKVT